VCTYKGYFTLSASTSGLPNAAPVIYFPGALIYSAGFNINQNLKKKIFLNNSMFQFFRSTPMDTVCPLFQSCFLLYPFYCPLTPHFPLSLEKGLACQVTLQKNNASEPTLLWGTGHYYCRGVINLYSLNSPSRTLSCLQIKLVNFKIFQEIVIKIYE
jgi:hypothetical protein